MTRALELLVKMPLSAFILCEPIAKLLFGILIKRCQIWSEILGIG